MLLSKEYYERLKRMDSLTLVTSAGCNLNCEYCLIAQNKNSRENSENIQLNTIKALQDGSFLKNVSEDLKYFKIPRTNIKEIGFWGQEPTLTIKYFTQNIKDWLTAFPSLYRISFSTNGMDFGEDLFEFLKGIDENTNKPFEVRIQVSYDGEYSTNNIRNANNTQIVNNLLKMLNKSNMYIFKNMDIEIAPHGVISFDLLSKLTTSDKIYNYFKEMDEFCYTLISANNNPKINIIPFVGLGIENPYNGSTDDGINLATFLKKGRLIDCKDFHYKKNPIEHLLSILINPMEKDRFLPLGMRLGENCIDRINNPYEYASLSEMLSCGANYSEFKIMYDGTLVPCQNLIYDTKEIAYSPNDTKEDYIRKSLANHHVSVNPITDDDDTIAKGLDRFYIGRTCSFIFAYNQICSLMFLMAKYGQIDSEYITNKKKLLSHAYILLTIIGCGYNNMITTGSLYSRSTGTIRTYANGVIDLMQDKYDKIREECQEGARLNGF